MYIHIYFWNIELRSKSKMDQHSCSLSTCRRILTLRKEWKVALGFSGQEKSFCSVNCTSFCSYKSKGFVCLFVVCF